MFNVYKYMELQKDNNPKKAPDYSRNITSLRDSFNTHSKNTRIRSFYICSYGGSGSYMLYNFLKQYGKTYHVHSRKPPNSLSTTKGEWFTNMPPPENEDPTVIYIYRDPIKAIYSRFESKDHLVNIQVFNPNVKISNILRSKRDLYGIEAFFDNYTLPNHNRNYPIYCVKYEDFFNNVDEFKRVIGLPNDKNKPEEKITVREYANEAELREIYAPLLQKMNMIPFIKIV